MRAVKTVQFQKGIFNISVDPCFLAAFCRFGAQLDNLMKRSVGGHTKTILPYSFG
jgi:hypothetical protein